MEKSPLCSSVCLLHDSLKWLLEIDPNHAHLLFYRIHYISMWDSEDTYWYNYCSTSCLYSWTPKIHFHLSSPEHFLMVITPVSSGVFPLAFWVNPKEEMENKLMDVVDASYPPHKHYKLLSLILWKYFMTSSFPCREKTVILVNYCYYQKRKLVIIYNWGSNLNTFSLYSVEHWHQ